MTDIIEHRPSKLLASDEYWTGLLPIEVLPRNEEYDMFIAEHIGMAALCTTDFYTYDVPQGDYLPNTTASAFQTLQLVLDSRMTLEVDGRHTTYPAIFRSPMPAPEFDIRAEALLWGGPKADGRPPVRLTEQQENRIIEVGRSIVYAASGSYAPHVGRPAHALMQPVFSAPNIVLPYVAVGQPFRLPAIGHAVQDFRVTQARLLTPRSVPPGLT